MPTQTVVDDLTLEILDREKIGSGARKRIAFQKDGSIAVEGKKVVGAQQAAIAAVAAADAGTATTADADATYGQAEADLINELKADYNAAVTLINELKTKLNSALTALRAHGIIAT